MNPLLKLLIDNRHTSRKCEIQAKGKEATLYLYDAIVASDIDAEWFGGVSAASLAKEIRNLDAEIIHLRINSPGGDVFGARIVEQALRDHKATVIAYIDGLAASAATFLMLAADEIQINQGGFIMIHNASTIAWGNANDIQKAVDMLRKVDTSIAESYATRTGKEVEDLANMMAEETWLSANEALEMKFVDKVMEGQTKASASWNLSAYANAPASVNNPVVPPVPEKPTVEDAPAKEPEPNTQANADTDHMRRRLQLAKRTA